jgi:hypothetical protein
VLIGRDLKTNTRVSVKCSIDKTKRKDDPDICLSVTNIYELSSLQQLNHENIIKLIRIDENSAANFVLEYADFDIYV